MEHTRHAAYFASLQQILPYFAQLYPELCDTPDSFQQTQLYRELAQCQLALVDAAGAATAVEIDLGSMTYSSRTRGFQLRLVGFQQRRLPQ